MTGQKQDPVFTPCTREGLLSVRICLLDVTVELCTSGSVNTKKGILRADLGKPVARTHGSHYGRIGKRDPAPWPSKGLPGER